MHSKQIIGDFGEELACEYLKRLNYVIIDRNFSCYQGEIDIIAKDTLKNELVFIEVKTRTSLKYGSPIDGVNSYKKNHLFKACQYYLYKYNLYKVFIRIDIIEIYVKNNVPHLRHIKQII